MVGTSVMVAPKVNFWKFTSDIFLPQASQRCAEMPLGMVEELAQARCCLLQAV